MIASPSKPTGRMNISHVNGSAMHGKAKAAIVVLVINLQTFWLRDGLDQGEARRFMLHPLK
jgi:hypothetical protein